VKVRVQVHLDFDVLRIDNAKENFVHQEGEVGHVPEDPGSDCLAKGQIGYRQHVMHRKQTLSLKERTRISTKARARKTEAILHKQQKRNQKIIS